jgi:hypothetical protein
MDNELRFYSARWGAYGIALLVITGNLDKYGGVFYAATIFFVGGERDFLG